MAANVSSSQVGGLTAGVVHVLAVIPEIPITVVDSQFPSTTLTLQFSPDATVEQLETQIREILRLRNSVAGTDGVDDAEFGQHFLEHPECNNKLRIEVPTTRPGPKRSCCLPYTKTISRRVTTVRSCALLRTSVCSTILRPSRAQPRAVDRISQLNALDRSASSIALPTCGRKQDARVSERVGS